ncbi:MAG TPA: ABC transporter ATP-binding protein [Solirubrobacteraceae bacterium]|jgi:branched-chain amino acid transport system ATP-binding protein|nr:ABC transporter ATP-binding protein [Solirubrobacteraceae bacterium]
MQTEAHSLSVDHIASSYGDVRVLWDVSLQVPVGSVHALLGRNGAGKTTTLRTIAGLNKCQSGTILHAGRDVTKAEAHTRARGGIALVESKRIFRRRTVEENLVLGGYTLRMRPGRGDRHHAFDEVYELFPDLHGRRHVVAGGLSGGQQQMVAIAQALVRRPDLLMLDEPTAGLAPAMASEVLATVRRVREVGITVLLVEQAVELVLGVADSLTVIDRGHSTLDMNVTDHDVKERVEAAYFSH